MSHKFVTTISVEAETTSCMFSDLIIKYRQKIYTEEIIAYVMALGKLFIYMQKIDSRPIYLPGY